MSDFYFKNVENNNSRRLYDITDIFNLVQSVPAWELPAKMQISAAVKPIFHCSGGVFVCVWRGGGETVRGEKTIWAYKKMKRCASFSSAPNTRTHSERVHAWLSPVSVAVIVNTATGCYFHRQSLVLNSVTPT